MGSKILWFLVVTLIAAGETNKIIEEKCHPDDLKGLTNFKTGIHSDNSGRVEKWTGPACCKWEGISCDGTTGRVTQINLPGFITSDDDDAPPLQTCMNGFLSPDSITLLAFLEVVDLSGLVGLTGKIPPLIGFHLPMLRKLSLWGNSFEGPLPESIGNMSKLEELYLYDNSFNGSLPESLGFLEGLRMLDLHSNRFSGDVPESIANLTNLENLSIENNFLTGKIPSNIGDLQGLKVLDLSNNSLSRKIPSSITKLKSITTIYLNNNRLVGEIPQLLSPDQMSYLGFLKLNDNKLTGTIPYSFGYLTSLQRVSLANNRLNGSIPSSFGNLRSLTELYLNDNELSGKLPSSISRLSQLLMLRVYNNMIEGPLPHQMVSMVNLQTLDVSFNRLNLTSIPKWLLKLPSLSRIYFAGCKINGNISEDLLATPSPLQELDLSSNQITGIIPEWIGKLTELYSLNLSFNVLVGEIPSSITNLASLGVLDLHSNKLSGSLKWVFEIQSKYASDGGSLTFLDLSYNNFTSGVEQIGMGVQIEIQYINLSHNLLEGRLPDSIGRLEAMKSLDLSCNHFTGRIPNGFLKLENLKELDLSDNFLEGEIPFGKPLINFPRDSYSGNKGLCGVPLEPCRP